MLPNWCIASPSHEELIAGFAEELKEAGAEQVFAISGATGQGIEELLDAVLGYLPQQTSTETPGRIPDEDDDNEPGEWSPLG